MPDRYAGEGDVERLSSTRPSAHLYSLFGNVGLVLGARLLALLAAMPCIQPTYDSMQYQDLCLSCTPCLTEANGLVASRARIGGLANDLPKVANCDAPICMRALKLDHAWLVR
jgi:hypothetical protein